MDSSPQDVFPGDSQTGSILRDIDWARTPMGPIDAWSPSLKTCLNICLMSPLPTLIVWGPEFITFYNDACALLLGEDHPGALGAAAPESLTRSWSVLGAWMAEVQRTGRPVTVEEVRLPHQETEAASSGSFTVSANAIFDNNATNAGVFAQITRTPQPASRDRHVLPEAFPEGTWRADAAGRITELSRRWLEITGAQSDLALGDGWLSLVHPEDTARVAKAWRHAIENGVLYDAERRIRTSSGEYRWMRSRAVPLRDQAGNIVEWYGSTEDIEDRKRAEEMIRVSERRVRIAQEAAGVLIWEWGEGEDHVTWGPGVAKIYGREAKELDFATWLASLHPDDREPTVERLNQALNGSGKYDGDYRVIWPDGSIHWLVAKGELFRDPESKRSYIVGANIDITDRKLTEQALRESETQLREVLERTTDAVFVLDAQWRFTYLNPNAASMIASGRDLLGKNIWEEFPEAVERNFYTAYHRAMNERVPVQFQEYYPRPLDRWYAVNAYPTREGIAIFFHDSTAQRKSEDALRQSEKLAAAGRLAASIAHEINNPLEAVTNLLYLLNSDASLSSQGQRFLRMAESELARVSHIANQTLRFYRQSTRPTAVNVAAVLDSVIAMHNLRHRHDSDIFIRQYGVSEEFLGLEGELRQVFANLIGNARDALEPEGKIVLRVSSSMDWRSGRPGVRVLVADNGHGMSEETRARLFEPFFSTKGIIGTGLGLWVSREIVEKQGGFIRVRSSQRPDWRGTTFEVFLPYAGPLRISESDSAASAVDAMEGQS